MDTFEMFEYHGCPERGQDMMRKVQTRVAETCGSVHAVNEQFTLVPEQPAMSAGKADKAEPPDERMQPSWTMRFNDLHLTGFQGAKDLTLGFEPEATVIAGRNGAGRTSILDALAINFSLSRTRSRKRRTTEVGLRPDWGQPGQTFSTILTGAVWTLTISLIPRQAWLRAMHMFSASILAQSLHRAGSAWHNRQSGAPRVRTWKSEA